MNKNLQKALTNQKKQNKQEVLQIAGSLGIPIGGQKRVEVPNRNSYVYVRLRDNPNEVIQAFNNKVAASYNLPVIVERQNNRYVVVSVDTLRYQNYWNSFAPFLPRHGNTHSFDYSSGGGGDIVWVYGKQFMPSLVMPSGSVGGPNVIMSGYVLQTSSGTWKYTGITGTQDLLTYKPTGTSAVMALVYLDAPSGNPYILVGSGSYFSASLTGTSSVVPYIPMLSNSTSIPLSAVRLVSGTSSIGWDNIYDVRQFIHVTSTGTGGGSSMVTGTNAVDVWDEGIYKGTVTTLNYVGTNVVATVSGSVANIFVTGSTGGSSIFAQDEGAPLGTVDTFNFVGGNVSASVSGTVVRVFVTGSNSMIIKDEGSTVGTVGTLNFVGSAVLAVLNGSTVDVYITGAYITEAPYDGNYYSRRFNTWEANIFSYEYISGLEMTWVTGTSLRVESGTAYVPSLLQFLNVSGTITKTGLALSNNTWYHVYVYSNAGTPDAEVVTTAPETYRGTAKQKTGDGSRRYVGSVRTDGSGNMYCFHHDPTTDEVLYSGNSNIGSSPFRCLNGGTGTIATEVSLAAVIPVTSNIGILRLNNTSDRNLFYGPTSSVVGPSLPIGSTTTTTFVGTFPLTETPGYWYKYNVTPTSGGAYIDVYGYYYER